MANLRHLLVDRTGMPGSPVLVALALPLIGGALAQASVGGRMAVAGIAILEAAAVAALLTWAGRTGWDVRWAAEWCARSAGAWQATSCWPGC